MQSTLLTTLFGQFDRMSRELTKLRDEFDVQKAEISELKIKLHTAELELALLRSQASNNAVNGVEVEPEDEPDADARKALKKQFNGNFHKILTFAIT